MRICEHCRCPERHHKDRGLGWALVPGGPLCRTFQIDTGYLPRPHWPKAVHEVNVGNPHSVPLIVYRGHRSEVVDIGL